MFRKRHPASLPHGRGFVNRASGGEAEPPLAPAISNQATSTIESAPLEGQAHRRATLEERQRLAWEMHDSVSRVAYAISLGGYTASTLLDGACVPLELESSLAEPLGYLPSWSRRTWPRCRPWSLSYNPTPREPEGLVVTLPRRPRATRIRHKLEVRTDHTG